MNHSCLLVNAQCQGTMNISQDSEKVRIHARVCKMQEIVSQRHILRIVGPGLRQPAGQTLCVVTVLSVQNNERWISTQRK